MRTTYAHNRGQRIDPVPWLGNALAPRAGARADAPAGGFLSAKRPRTTGTAWLRQQAKYQRQCSPLRHLGQGEVDDCGFQLVSRGTIHVILVERLAVTYRDLDAIALQEVASAGRNSRKYPYRQKDAKLAATQFRMENDVRPRA